MIVIPKEQIHNKRLKKRTKNGELRDLYRYFYLFSPPLRMTRGQIICQDTRHPREKEVSSRHETRFALRGNPQTQKWNTQRAHRK